MNECRISHKRNENIKKLPYEHICWYFTSLHVCKSVKRLHKICTIYNNVCMNISYSVKKILFLLTTNVNIIIIIMY